MQHRQTDPTFEGSARPLLVGLLAVQIFLGYEWFMSGLAKVLDGGFASSLAGTLSDQTKDLSGPYKSFLDSVVIPNGQLFGYLVTAGELSLGIVLVGAALLWLTRWSQMGFTGRQIVLGLIVLSGVVAIFMNVNFHIAGGANHPWLIAADPNGEGVDLDSLMPVIQVIISGVAFVFLRRLRSAQPAAVIQAGPPSAARA
jgi:uncharacterized membrane protein YphA (DoxX/SURF4 family)